MTGARQECDGKDAAVPRLRLPLRVVETARQPAPRKRSPEELVRLMKRAERAVPSFDVEAEIRQARAEPSA